MLEGRGSGIQSVSQEVEPNTAGATGEEDMVTGGGDTVETEESVEQDRDETVGYNNFPNTKLIFET